MRRRFFAAFYLVLFSVLLYGGDLNNLSLSVKSELERFYEGIYNAADPARIHADFHAVKEVVNSQAHTEFYKNFLTARITMIYGRHFISDDTAWYDPDFGEEHLRKALAAVEHMMKSQEAPELYALASEIRGSLFLLRPLRYLLTHGRAANRLAAQARRADDANLDVLILLGNEALYTPGIYGGSPRSAYQFFISALDVFQRQEAAGFYADPASLFTIYSGIGIALKDIGMPAEAASWLEAALRIYPYNPYITSMRDELSQ